MKKTLSIILLLCFLLGLCSCSIETNEIYQKEYKDLFDTYSKISAYDESEESFEQNVQNIYKELKTYSELYDIYNDYDGVTNLKYVNENAAKAPVKVDSKIIELLEYGVKAYDISGGCVNIALGSVLSVWHDYREEGKEVPSKDLLKEVNKHTDIANLVIDKENSTVFFNDKDMKLDVGAITKGFVTEKICQYIKDNGIWESYIISLGGNIKVGGYKNGNEKFTIAIENPSGDGYLEKLAISNGYSVVTSGDYQRYYEVDGVRYCHIIDPNTLTSANNFQSVSVVSNDSELNDVLSTTLFIMDLDDGLKLVNGMKNVEAVWLDKDGNKTYSDGFKELIK